MLPGKLWDFSAADFVCMLIWSWTMDWHTQGQIDDIYAGVQCSILFWSIHFMGTRSREM